MGTWWGTAPWFGPAMRQGKWSEGRDKEAVLKKEDRANCCGNRGLAADGNLSPETPRSYDSFIACDTEKI